MIALAQTPIDVPASDITYSLFHRLADLDDNVILIVREQLNGNMLYYGRDKYTVHERKTLELLLLDRYRGGSKANC